MAALTADAAMAWHEIGYQVPTRHSKRWPWQRTTSKQTSAAKTLLQDISGSVPPGSMLAIMGPSGAGKSTLLDVLSGRKRPTSGHLLTPNDVDVRRISSYVEQEDALLGVLTVRETIWYSAKLSFHQSSPFAGPSAEMFVHCSLPDIQQATRTLKSRFLSW